MKPATLVGTIFIFVVAVLHLVRILLHVELTVNGVMVPMWMSIVAFLFTGGLAIMMFRENRHK
jgi:hypothetical protein